MTTITPLASVYTQKESLLMVDQDLSFDKVAIQPTTSDVVLTGNGFVIRGNGVYEITYGITSRTGGLLAVIALPPSIQTGIIEQSKLYVLPNTSASITFQYNCTEFTQIEITNLGNVPISIDGYQPNSSGITQSTTAYFSVKKI